MKISRQISILLILFGFLVPHSTSWGLSSDVNFKNPSSHQNNRSPNQNNSTSATQLKSASKTENTGRDEIAPQDLTNKQKIIRHLDELVASYAAKGYRSEYVLGKLDPLIMNRTCDEEINLSLNKSPEEQNNLTILVSCQSAKPWKYYLSLKFNLFGQSVFAAHNIVRGQTLQAQDLVYKDVIVNQFTNNYYHSSQDVIGMVAKRTMRANSPIQANFLQPPKVIKRGDTVVIIAASPAISVRMNGTALADGLLGQQIPVKNQTSKRIVKARVEQAGIVKIAL